MQRDDSENSDKKLRAKKKAGEIRHISNTYLKPMRINASPSLNLTAVETSVNLRNSNQKVGKAAKQNTVEPPKGGEQERQKYMSPKKLNHPSSKIFDIKQQNSGASLI